MDLSTVFHYFQSENTIFSGKTHHFQWENPVRKALSVVQRQVTLVAMLSVRGAYVGGRSCFRRAQSSRGHRELSLEQGDVVTWRGI